MTKFRRPITVLLLAIGVFASGVAVSYSQNSGSGSGKAGEIVGAVVRFTSGSTSVDLTIDQDNPAVRDFLSRLPLTLKIEEYAGREKIAYFDTKLTTSGSPGSDPDNGDLIYFTPWGNIGFYYNASGVGFSNQTIHIGKYNASNAQLDQLTRQPVRVERIR
ncbi:hypothetical protein C241_16693 [Bradyrhizobium lupini HPC(L)]|uniref:Cyclophilin-like domain-containing protein n=1 Tax=Bradyrhizobium lupini HPC(L) TaxID=1229491 RepID=A0ABP2RPH9_RHILU|nr:hypothetical protein C241_16693 [Bradyrhizobium lupini HPC(L)]